MFISTYGTIKDIIDILDYAFTTYNIPKCKEINNYIDRIIFDFIIIDNEIDNMDTFVKFLKNKVLYDNNNRFIMNLVSYNNFKDVKPYIPIFYKNGLFLSEVNKAVYQYFHNFDVKLFNKLTNIHSCKLIQLVNKKKLLKKKKTYERSYIGM